MPSERRDRIAASKRDRTPYKAYDVAETSFPPYTFTSKDVIRMIWISKGISRPLFSRARIGSEGRPFREYSTPSGEKYIVNRNTLNPNSFKRKERVFLSKQKMPSAPTHSGNERIKMKTETQNKTLTKIVWRAYVRL